jgi:hypothetical protein
VEFQLRVYEVKPDAMEDWIAEWTREVYPLRRAHGFDVLGAWREPATNIFVWLLGYDGDFAAADAAYYNSPERAALQPDPTRHLVRTEHRSLRSVLD